MPGPPLGFPLGPEDLLVENDGSPRRIDRAYSWEAPMSAHGLMHLVIGNAARGDPYPIDTLFMYMANMSWNSSMNVPGTIEQLTAWDDEAGEYRIPRIIYSRCLLLGDGALRRPDPARHHIPGTVGLHFPARPADL